MTANPWRKLENENGFPFYGNEVTNVKQWDHPEYNAIINTLDDFNYIKYTSYRLATKIRCLQNLLHMNDVPLTVIIAVFDRHKLGTTEGSLCLESYDLEAVLSDVYFAVNKMNCNKIDIDLATELMLNFLYNIYDKDRLGKIQVISTRLILGLLSNYKLEEFYQYLFNLSIDHNNCMTKLRLQSTLTKLNEFIGYIYETSGDDLIYSAVNDCFSNSPGFIGITESNFHLWTSKNPIIFSWLPVLCRIRSSESVVHNIKCGYCKVQPIRGLLYKCAKCTNYLQCHHCFFSGNANGKHKLSHSMDEFCTEYTRKQNASNLMRKLRSLMPCSKHNVDSTFITNTSLVNTKSINKNSLQQLSPISAITSDTTSAPHVHIQNIIKQLELLNKALYERLLNSNKVDIRKHIEEHKENVENLTRKLKLIKDVFSTKTDHANKSFLQSASTPLVPSSKCKTNISMFSPINKEFRNNVNDHEELQMVNTRDEVDNTDQTSSYDINDISTWIGGHPRTPALKEVELNVEESAEKANRNHNDLDEALAKLQQILANNFMLDESLGNIDNGQLKCAVTEFEGMLTSLIDNVECDKVHYK